MKWFNKIVKKLYFKIMAKEHAEQEQLDLTFYVGRDGKTIARTLHGKICLLDIQYCRENRIYVNEYEDWRCSIKEEREHCVIVQPIQKLLSAKDNETIFGEKIDMLKNKFGKG